MTGAGHPVGVGFYWTSCSECTLMEVMLVLISFIVLVSRFVTHPKESLVSV